MENDREEKVEHSVADIKKEAKGEKRHAFTYAEKRKIVAEAKHTEDSKKSVAEKHGITPVTLYKWINQFSGKAVAKKVTVKKARTAVRANGVLKTASTQTFSPIELGTYMPTLTLIAGKLSKEQRIQVATSVFLA